MRASCSEGWSSTAPPIPGRSATSAPAIAIIWPVLLRSNSGFFCPKEHAGRKNSRTEPCAYAIRKSGGADFLHQFLRRFALLVRQAVQQLIVDSVDLLVEALQLGVARFRSLDCGCRRS